MAGYGYTYRSFSSYSTVRDEPRGPVIKPFVPFVPNTTNSNSEAYVTKKTIVPVASKPYGDEYNYNNRSSPTEAYPARGDDEWHRPTSPVRGSPRKVDDFLTKGQNEASRPATFSPVTSTDRRQSPQPTAYNGANGYGSDYGSSKEGRKPIGGTIRNDNYDGYNGTHGYGDYGSNKEGRKPIGGTIRNDNFDGYNGNNGYGDYGSNKEGRKPIGSTIRNDSYDGYNDPNGYYGDYGNKEGRKPTGSPVRNDNYGGYNGANNGHGGYGNYNNNKVGQRSLGSITRNDDYDGYSGGGNGYGDYGNYSNKEGYKPSGSPGGWTRPKISSAWTAAPRKGVQLSEPTNDIGKAMELLKEAAKLASNDHNSNQKGGHKSTTTALPHNNYDDYQRRHDGEPTSKFDKGMELVKEAERLKNIVTSGAPQSRSSVPIEPATPNKNDYGETTGRYGNLNFSSRPRTPPTHVTFIDGREGDYRDDTRRYGNASLPGSIIDSREAEKKYKGKRI